MRINNRERILLMLLLMVIFTWLAYAYLIEGQFKSIRENNIELKVSQNELEGLQKLVSKESEIDKQIEESYMKVQEVASSFFNTTPQEERILLINDLFQMPNVQDSAISFSSVEEIEINGLAFEKDTVSIQLSGQYGSVMNMFRTIWQFPKQMDISSLSLSAQGFDEVNGEIQLDFYTFAAESGIVDNLYQWYPDEMFYKENPFAQAEDNGIILRYLYTGDDKLFNYSRFFEFTDIEDHWAQSEIEEFLDYGYLYMNPYQTFGPDEPITRGEFIVMLDNVYDWEPIYSDEVDLTGFRDYEDLGSLEGAFAKAVAKGYLSGFVEGYTDNTLRPREPITYEEVNFLMNRIKGTDGFLWTNIGASIQLRKGVNDARWNKPNETLTRAEAVYLLYYYK